MPTTSSRQPSGAPWIEIKRQEIRDAASCPTCLAKAGAPCMTKDGAPRLANHAARHEAVTGQDPTRYAYGNQRRRAAAKKKPWVPGTRPR